MRISSRRQIRSGFSSFPLPERKGRVKRQFLKEIFFYFIHILFYSYAAGAEFLFLNCDAADWLWYSWKRNEPETDGLIIIRSDYNSKVFYGVSLSPHLFAVLCQTLSYRQSGAQYNPVPKIYGNYGSYDICNLVFAEKMHGV